MKNIPISVAMNMFKTDLIAAINKYNMPISIKEAVLAGVHNELKDLAQKELEVEQKSYESSLSESQEATADGGE